MRRTALIGALLLLAFPVGLAAVTAGPATATGQSPPSELARQEVPGDLLAVYQAASLDCPGLPWQVLAAIGWTESRHAQGRADPATGQVSPPILGPAIDGRPGFAAIRDPASPDGWAHAVGPMQFLTTTWRAWATLAPERPDDATPDPHNAWDAIYTAAAYLCAGKPRLGDLHAAVLRYNRSETYYRTVLDKARQYGLGSRTRPVGGPLQPGSGEGAVAAALTQLGVPYVWGGTTPGVGLDCSGLTQWAYKQVGVNLPRTTQQQVLVGVEVPLDQLRPGDLIFTRSIRGGTTVNRGHVAIYAGNNQVIVAPRTGDVVKVRPLIPSAVQAVRRVTSASPGATTP